MVTPESARHALLTKYDKATQADILRIVELTIKQNENNHNMTYKLLPDSRCISCIRDGYSSDCGAIDNIPAKQVWQNLETKKIVTFMADGGECYTTEPVEAETAYPAGLLVQPVRGKGGDVK